MYKAFEFGKIAYRSKNNKKINAVNIEVKLKYKENKNPVFSACAEVWNARGTDIIAGGQMLDKLQPFFSDNDLFMEIFDLWKKYHLNDMHSGTPKQEKALKEKGLLKADKYNAAVEYLKSIDLYQDEYNNHIYTYSKEWVYWPIPDDDIKRIEALFKETE